MQPVDKCEMVESDKKVVSRISGMDDVAMIRPMEMQTLVHSERGRR